MVKFRSKSFHTKVRKITTYSLGIIIPATWKRDYNIKEGTEVKVSIELPVEE